MPQLNIKTKLMWNLSPQKRELQQLEAELKQQGLSPTKMKRWGYLKGIQREMDKITI